MLNIDVVPSDPVYGALLAPAISWFVFYGLTFFSQAHCLAFVVWVPRSLNSPIDQVGFPLEHPFCPLLELFM